MNLLLDDYWNKTLSLFRESEKIDDIAYNNFYASSKLTQLGDNIATVVAGSKMHKIVMQGEVEKLQAHLKDVIGRFVAIHIITEGEKVDPSTPNIPKVTPIVESDGVQSNFTFDNFIVGPSNRESHAAALATAYNPGKYYNPLFIYGNSGLGKTHLLNAIGNYIKKNSSNIKVKYIPCVEFVNAYIRSIAEKSIDQFNEMYRSVDVLLVDDIQFLAGKEKSHEMFFHLFNELISNRKQIVITSDRHPEELRGLEDRLVSRFSQGLSVGIDSPEFETALAILQNKLSFMNDEAFNFDEDVLAYIASRFSNDVRKLEGALNRIIFYSINFSESSQITMDIALQAFKGMDSIQAGEELTLEKIKNVVADYYGLTRAQIISKSRTSNIANARHIAIYLCRKHLDIPFAKIGDAFGKRDHSTIMSSYEKVDNLLKTNSTYRKAIEEIEKMIITK
ncbi:MAG: chromosomal replication initiator protein DnaA [Erysipelotrichaceae bacterium]|nr:chromosomal replication initiator protein DnaA [Erysipelotrichaceae bacterium]MBQ9987440.1 chromosomal replication initiator protein DnaA [Erysipelotrichales bacterium]MBR3694462.1 chromosomal replication initiator protein DnaA [Erysipelotrichales bacterium]